MFRFTKKRAVVAMAIVGSLALSAGAYAYFASTGAGSGSATVGTATAWTVTDVVRTGDALSPGTGVQTIAYKVTNPGSTSQRLTKVTLSVGTVDGTWDGPGDCSAADFSVNGGHAGDSYEDVANAGTFAPGAVVNKTATIEMVDTGANQNACQGASPPLYMSVS